MRITKLLVENFKSFKERFEVEFTEGLNIVVGDNEAGKSTILEAINLALTGFYINRPLRGELNQYLFNEASVRNYLDSLKGGAPESPPQILIELYLTDEEPMLSGDFNRDRIASSGIHVSIEFNEEYRAEYEALIAAGELKTLPIEYYHVIWKSFSRELITARSIPIKCAYIDSTSARYQNGSDVYIGRIVKDLLSPEEIVSVSQSHRQMKETFMGAPAIDAINKKITVASKITDKEIKISVELSSKNAWESGLMTYLNEIPFHFIGKGEQSIVKTNLALAHEKAKEASVVLIEEPENHLSHSKLNQLINTIKISCIKKQVIVTTHSSFVANKLGLNSLILLDNKKTLRLNKLSLGTWSFFEKISGYDTLRLVLCKKAILVEGDSDELVVQKAYKDIHGVLPIENCVEVISVGISFLRFLEIAEKLEKQVSVVTDNDGDVPALLKKYSEYLGAKKKPYIDICYDSVVDVGALMIGGKPFNYNTLEPKLLKSNGLAKMNLVLGTAYLDHQGLQVHMRANKTECALKVFDSKLEIAYPDYILDSIK